MGLFEEKKREPQLSKCMQNVIERSQHLSYGESYDQIGRYKYSIMKKLLSNPDILRTLHNEELEKDIEFYESDGKTELSNVNGESYKYVNIFDFQKIPGIQSTVKNYICFAISEQEQARYNEDIIYYRVMFRTISHEDDYKTGWGINRQDLLAAIIKYDFDWTNEFGMHFSKDFDTEKVYENGYYYREFSYEIKSPNSLQNKLRNGVGINGRE